MEVYLIGHGGWLEEDGYFDMPRNVVLHFYCPHTKKFDSSWENAVRAGQAVAHQDFSHERGPQRCRNYRLAHPGGIKSKVGYDSLHPLIPPHYIGANLRDQLNCAVKDRVTHWYVHLKDILNSIRPNGAVCHVHWLACRDDLKGIASDFEREAKGRYGGIYGGEPKKAVGKLDMSKFQLKFG
ncbi:MULTISPECIES: putative adhesin [unclassified Hahella]|uniref:putative adhesin n=1 Tax=unclassified Hahella TaxID=2624107 RepID=UPI001C1EEEDD|nr:MULTISPECIES: hypothetical protein [unclassified Hahella]MBU6953401.1 hypothetical protein [Hahella sp. HN01]MDG9669313.1 hypothetical protein [Hahella sp. CR1]